MSAEKNKKTFLYLSLITDVGLGMILPILAGLGIGIFLDNKFFNNGLAIIIGIILGVISGFWNCYKIISKMNIS